MNVGGGKRKGGGEWCGIPRSHKCWSEPHDMTVEDSLAAVRMLLVPCVSQASCVTDVLVLTQ